MPSGLGPFEPTVPFQPGTEYLRFKDTGAQPSYEDFSIVYLDLQVYVTEEFPVVYFDLQASGTATAQYIDLATIYFDLRNTGGECFSSSSALNLQAEAYVRWFADAIPRWEAEESARWLTTDAFPQFICTEDDVYPQWVVIGISTDQGC